MKHPVPNYSQFNLGAFAYAEQEIVADVRATAALRYDTRAMDIAERRRSDSARSIINEAVSRSFTVTQAAVGFVWKPTSDFSTSLNISSGWRAPVAAELFSVGRDEGEIQYRVGNSNLRPERARNIEFAARYHSAHLVGDLTFFRQEIADYIYAVPTGATKENVPEYVYTQNNALLSGVELSAQAEIVSRFVVGLGADVVRGSIESSGSPLQRTPAARILGSFEYTPPSMGSISDINLWIHPRYVFAQSRVGELESASSAYFTLTIGAGGSIAVMNTLTRVSLTIDNGTNTAYVDHLSRYRQLALNPGRSLSVRISLPFEVSSIGESSR